MKSVLIVGAGISGLLAATVLQARGVQVTVVDKGRGVGGRMANRRMSSEGIEARADHGAQFFTVREPMFNTWVEKWIEAGVVVEWTRGFNNQDGHPRYRGATGMTAIAKHLAASLHVQTGTRLTKISAVDNLWIAEAENETVFQAEGLIMTPPVPQSLVLLDAGHVSLDPEARAALSAINYHPVFAVMARLTGPSKLSFPGGVQVRGEIIDWIGDNHIKGISPTTTVTIHATPDFTRAHLEQDRHDVAEMLIEEADRAGYFDKGLVDQVQVQRWMYSQPAVFYPDRCLKTEVNRLPLVFAGDAFMHARVEGAALSGLAAADELVNG